MGGWHDAPRAPPSRARREERRSFAARAGGAPWRVAIAPVKDAARSSSSGDALRTAVRSFLDDSSGLGPPPDGDATPAEISADVLLLVRAVNRPDVGGAGATSTSGRGALDALVGDLLAAQRLLLDREFVATLAEYYLGALTTDADDEEEARAVFGQREVLIGVGEVGGVAVVAAALDVLGHALEDPLDVDRLELQRAAEREAGAADGGRRRGRERSRFGANRRQMLGGRSSGRNDASLYV